MVRVQDQREVRKSYKVFDPKLLIHGADPWQTFIVIQDVLMPSLAAANPAQWLT